MLNLVDLTCLDLASILMLLPSLLSRRGCCHLQAPQLCCVFGWRAGCLSSFPPILFAGGVDRTISPAHPRRARTRRGPEEHRIFISIPLQGGCCLLRLAMDASAFRCGRHSHPPSPAAPEGGLCPSGDGETQCLKVRSDAVLDGPSLRSQAAIRPCGFSIA